MTEQGKTRWPLVFAIWAAGLGVAAQYGKISIVFDRLAQLYPDAGASISFTVSLVGLMGIVFGLVAGMFVASFGFRRTIVCSLWVGAAMSALQAMHLPFAIFLATRVIEGLSHLGVVVAAPVLMAQLSSNRDRGLVMTLWSTFFGVAFTLLAWLGLPLVAAQGVLALFWIHAGVMAGLALLLGFALRDVPVPAREARPAFKSLPALHLPVYRSAWKVAPAAGWLFYTCCFVAILTVIPPYIAVESRGFVLGAMPLASIAVSMTVGVQLLRRVSAVTVVQMGFLFCAASVLWLWAMPGYPLACITLAGAMGLVQGASFAAIPQLNESAAARAESSGVLAQSGNLGNTIGTPLMVAALGVSGFGGLMATLLVLFLGGFGVHVFLAAQRRGVGG
ncbi:Major Facilitator Superfamily protein [Phaeobacter sp. CECT 5382]|uniref:MFS transporter n=1 Tax=Phaeobacter sp. CECT 5382 TaxID=1712645 RepID=UPI0006D941B0|nr:MFS transporter [Phaeobacter sp. CECT 5382]CUH87478.1 Major Facilitator Superfamily protein [Phaeobacter sp. CECT 5382]